MRALQRELHLPDALCRLLCQRGFTDPETAKQYLRPRMEQLHDPGSMRGLPEAVARIARSIGDGETILVHGDYDVDGICSTALLLSVLRALGGRAEPFIPHRLRDGYDLSLAGVRAAEAVGARLLVTCDCGTKAHAAVAAACASGIDVIISDHHLPDGPMPPCVAVLNPRHPDCAYPDKDLAAVGIAFKLALALVRAAGVDEDVVWRHLDLVALATVADVAPLRGENRILVRYGLRALDRTQNVGLRALVRAARLDGRPLTAGRVGFVLAPRLNAAGRLGDAIRGVELLITEDAHEANLIARELEELNRRRQDVDRRTLDEAWTQIERLDLDTVMGVVLAARGWHPGVIGIVASRIVERLHRPVVLVAIDGEEGKGSGRSIGRFDLHAGLSECRDLLVRFGGHRAAAGVTLAAANVEAFAERFNTVARARLTPDDLVPELRIDLELPLAAAGEEMERLLRHFEPFGIGNPGPVLVSRGVQLAAPARVVGEDHLKLRLTEDGVELDAIGWGMGALAAELQTGRPMDVAFRLEMNEWQGERRLQARLAGVRQ